MEGRADDQVEPSYARILILRRLAGAAHLVGNPFHMRLEACVPLVFLFLRTSKWWQTTQGQFRSQRELRYFSILKLVIDTPLTVTVCGAMQWNP